MRTRTRFLIALALCALVAPAARAERTTITSVEAPGRWPTNLIGSAVSMTAADTTNLNRLLLTGDGKDFLMIQNTDSSGHTARVEGPADEKGRTGTIEATVPANSTYILGPFGRDGWSNGGYLHFDGADATVEFGAFHTP